MTAVAPPISIQPLPRWDSGDGADSDNLAEDVTRMFMPRKSPQRQNTASYTGPSPSSSSMASSNTPGSGLNGDGPSTMPESSTLAQKKIMRTDKPDAAPALSRTRPTGPGAASSSHGMPSNSANQNHPVSSLNGRSHSAQSSQNGVKMEHSGRQNEPTAILALLPMTGTFDRKQINVPFSPETLRIGRQTNAKTLPTATNGYFDSKVLSRQHAEIWADRSGKIWIRDVKSSNGTFVNTVRLSPENRESEPHELREHDILELGIDIVSEDQKSIVHHKVSAKVELAGIYSATPALVDLVHVDPHTGQHFSGDGVGQSLPHMRERGNHSQLAGNGRLNGPPSLANGNGNIMGPPRQMNMWMQPITIEQVMRKLTGELKQARQQSRDLRRTSDFFGTLMALEPGQGLPKSPERPSLEESSADASALPDAVEVALREDFQPVGPISPFSQPPAPPPQQPLPAKPDGPGLVDAASMIRPLTRTNTEKPRSPSLSPHHVDAQSGQVMSLMNALQAANQESDSQGNRIRYLELALQRERRAREAAEERVQSLSGGRIFPERSQESDVEDDLTPAPLDSISLMEKDLPNGHLASSDDSSLRSSLSVETLTDTRDLGQGFSDLDTSASRLQARVELMAKEMDEMKSTMESYKQRAEVAEEGRRSLAEMVENIRAGRDPHASTSDGNQRGAGAVSHDKSRGLDLSSEHDSKTSDFQHSMPMIKHLQNGHAAEGDRRQHHQLEKTLSNALQQQRRLSGDHAGMAQSVPYVSMVGVVIIGVGIMTWLNSWQPTSDR